MKTSKNMSLLWLRIYIVIAIILFVFKALDFSQIYNIPNFVYQITFIIAIILVLLGYKETKKTKKSKSL